MRKYRPRIYYTEADKALMWDRWRKGDSLEKIAQLFDRSHSSVARILVFLCKNVMTIEGGKEGPDR